MSDIFLLLLGMGIGLGMKVIMGALDVAIKRLEKDVP
jgi:hypothetical protein